MKSTPDDERHESGMRSLPGRQKEEFRIAFMRTFTQSLRGAGELVSPEAPAFPGEAKVVRAAKDGTPITDGVFSEAKEFPAGFCIVQVDTPERAYQIAAGASAAPGPGGAPMNMPIEVRQEMSGPPPELL
jgi:hypothetical protein